MQNVNWKEVSTLNLFPVRALAGTLKLFCLTWGGLGLKSTNAESSSSEVELHSSTYSTRWINLGYIFFGILLGLEPGMFPVHTAMLPSEPFWLRLRFTIGKVQNQLFRVKKTLVNSHSVKIQDLGKLGLDYLLKIYKSVKETQSLLSRNRYLRTQEIAIFVHRKLLHK